MKKYFLLILIVLIIAGLIFLVIGSFRLFHSASSEKLIYLPETANFIESDKEVEEEKKNLILVDLNGAVLYPGPYEVLNGSHLYELINLAGGFTGKVDKEYLNKELNLVSTITENQKLYIPFKNDDISLNSKTKNLNNELISINQSSLDKLQELPKIGEVKAQKIIENRPFQGLNDLVTKEIISETLFQELEKLITL